MSLHEDGIVFCRWLTRSEADSRIHDGQAQAGGMMRFIVYPGSHDYIYTLREPWQVCILVARGLGERRCLAFIEYGMCVTACKFKEQMLLDITQDEQNSAPWPPVLVCCSGVEVNNSHFDFIGKSTLLS